MSNKKEIRPRLTEEDYQLFLLLKETMRQQGVENTMKPIDNRQQGVPIKVPQVHVPAKPIQKNFTEPGMYLLLGCVHAPAHNVSMMNGITNLLIDYKDQLKGFVLMGDFLDMNTLSGHDTGKFTAVPGLTLAQEYESGEKLLSQLTEPLSKDITKVFLYGNHSDRFLRYMADMESSKRPLQSPEEALKLAEKGFHVFNKWKDDFVTLGDHLDVFHGQFYNVHCAKKTMDVFKGSVAFCHSHRVQSYIEGKTGAFNIGWGGDVTSPFFNYMPRGTKSMWQNGFAIVVIDEHGNYYLEQIIHYNGRFYYGGKKYN